MDKIGYIEFEEAFQVATNELLHRAGMAETELVPLVCAKNILEAMQKVWFNMVYWVWRILQPVSGRICTYF